MELARPLEPGLSHSLDYVQTGAERGPNFCGHHHHGHFLFPSSQKPGLGNSTLPVTGLAKSQMRMMAGVGG